MELTPDADGFTVAFEADEISVLDHLLGGLELVLGSEGREDPVRARLFPQAYADSDEDQRSYEELVGNQLRDEKLGVVRKIRAALTDGPIAVPVGEIDSWLVVLTDLRLALGIRLGVTEDLMGREEIDADDPAAGAMTVLHWLGWVQESMLSRLSD